MHYFHHCAFSNESSSFLSEKKHSHIACICLTFLQCVFSNVSSNVLPERRWSHIDCIWSTFPHCVFQLHPQIACPSGGIITQVAFVSRHIIFIVIFTMTNIHHFLQLDQFQSICFKLFLAHLCSACQTFVDWHKILKHYGTETQWDFLNLQNWQIWHDNIKSEMMIIYNVLFFAMPHRI